MPLEAMNGWRGSSFCWFLQFTLPPPQPTRFWRYWRRCDYLQNQRNSNHCLFPAIYKDCWTEKSEQNIISHATPGNISEKCIYTNRFWIFTFTYLYRIVTYVYTCRNTISWWFTCVSSHPSPVRAVLAITNIYNSSYHQGVHFVQHCLSVDSKE